MVKVEEDSAMAEPKPANGAAVHSTSTTRKTRHHNHSHHLTSYPLAHVPYHYYHYSYSSENSENITNGATSPAKFYFGPGFEPQSTISNTYGAGPSQGQNGSEYVVLFHVNPGVTISFQIGDSFEVLRATLNNLANADALVAQHEIQGVLFKYRLANVNASKHSSFQEPNSNKNTQTTPSYSYNGSLQSPYSNHSIDGYPHQQYSEDTNSTFYSDKHTNAPQQTNIEGQSLNLDATSLANEHTNDDSIISQALRFI
ncbi:hypothetical protein FQA39_LY06811 [Lamprigera yunnana]|nr:hypothetical protein FQA39_LY06811 [Lamprigera yunnana]